MLKSRTYVATAPQALVPPAIAVCLASLTMSHAQPILAQEVGNQPVEMVMPIPNAERGRELFVVKSCVVCHSINGVGGTAGPDMDASVDAGPVNPLSFAARMWTGAQAMADLQATEFGYQIELTGQEIADLAAFAADAGEQSKLSETDIPELMRGWVLDDF